MADKYTADQIKAMGAKGQAFKNADGHFSYPIGDAGDLDNAIKAVGRGGADHDAIRKYIIGRAGAMGKSSMIPDNWNADGSLKGQSSQDRASFELRKRRRASMFGKREARSCLMEMRAQPDGTGGTTFVFEGYGATFDSPFEMWDKWGEPYTEIVMPGAFSSSLGRPDLDVPFLIGHDDTRLALARTTNGTMRLAQDSRGLHVTAEMDGRRSDVRDLAYAVERGDMSEMSIGFVTRGQEWSEDYERRSMLDLDIHRGDVSSVPLAANPDTAGATGAWLPAELISQRRPRAEELAAPDAPDAEELMMKGTRLRLPMIDAALDQAQAIFAKADLSKLPPDIGQAIELVGSAGIHVDHILKHEGLPDPDNGAASNWSAGDPAAEERANPVDQNLGDSPDYNPSKVPVKCQNPGCPVAGGNVNPAGSRFCNQCGKNLGGGDTVITLAPTGIPSEEQPGSLMSLAAERAHLELRERELALLALVK